MKLGVLFHVFLPKCNGSLASSLTTAWFASCSSRRKREMRSAVILEMDERASGDEETVTDRVKYLRCCKFGE